MSVLTIDPVPELRQPILILAFAGWNDAGGAATTAAKFLSKHLDARKFASIDPEEFYDFTEQRPMIRLKDTVHREIIWPENDFYYTQLPELPQDIIIGIGVEPHLKWRTYVQAIFELIQTCHVSMVATLGALLAEVVHSRPVRVTGSTTDPTLKRRLRLSSSRYEGPTGIVGVLHDACRRHGLPAVSLWANIPHYISSPSNPKGALALV
ncbi:MAG: PAC2 family protein, partial [Nitrospinota bacterium]